MKKRLFAMVAAIIVMALVSACSVSTSRTENSPAASPAGTSSTGASPSASTSPAKTYKIGFANLTEALPFTVAVREGIEKAAKEKGIELVIANNNLDGATALANAENFLTQQVDAVIEYQTDAEFGNVIMDKFRAKSIPVIAIDIPMNGATFFGADNYKAGLMAGEGLGKAASEKWGGKVDKLILLELPQSGPLPAARMQGIREGLEKTTGKIDDANIIKLDSKGDVEVSYKLINDVLQKIPKGQKIAIGAITDDAAMGAVKSIEAAGRVADAMIVSQNGDQNIRKEIMREGSPVVGSTGYFPDKYGTYLIDAISKLLEGQNVPPSIYVDHQFLTKDNMAQYYPQ